jgi:hypothetical protein
MTMATKPNLDQGKPAAKRRNSPRPMAKQRRTNLVQTSTAAKKRNVPTPYAKNKEAQTMRPTPSNVPPRDLPFDARIHNELTTGSRSNSHSRKGR